MGLEESIDERADQCVNVIIFSHIVVHVEWENIYKSGREVHFVIFKNGKSITKY